MKRKKKTLALDKPGLRVDKDGFASIQIEPVLYDLGELVKVYELTKNQRIGIKRLRILQEDKNAPICINCKWCVQDGFLFHCIIFEDAMYYMRKNFRKTYSDAPMKSSDCKEYSPLTPVKL